MVTRLITPPAEEPVTVDEAKNQCKEDFADNDARIAVYISAARETCEHIIGRSIMTQTWEYVTDGFPCGGITLLYSPIASLTSIKYIDSVTGLEATLASNQYILNKDAEPGVVLPAYGLAWPSTKAVPSAVRVRYEAGYVNAEAVPASIKNWILLAVEYLYNQFKDGVENASIPRDFMGALLDRHRIWNM